MRGDTVVYRGTNGMGVGIILEEGAVRVTVERSFGGVESLCRENVRVVESPQHREALNTFTASVLSNAPAVR